MTIAPVGLTNFACPLVVLDIVHPSASICRANCLNSLRNRTTPAPRNGGLPLPIAVTPSLRRHRRHPYRTLYHMCPASGTLSRSRLTQPLAAVRAELRRVFDQFLALGRPSICVRWPVTLAAEVQRAGDTMAALHRPLGLSARLGGREDAPYQFAHGYERIAKADLGLLGVPVTACLYFPHQLFQPLPRQRLWVGGQGAEGTYHMRNSHLALIRYVGLPAFPSCLVFTERL